jgi:hypothetical protein
MKKLKLFLLILLLILASDIYSQTTQIGTPKLEFDGVKLQISYDIVSDNQSDQFYVWVVIQKKDGPALKMKSLSGDVGDIKAGKNKIITWVPANDSVYLNEEVTVEVKAEKYVKSYNKGSAMLLSVLVPGLGQTKMCKGKPYWIMGVASYGALAGGLVTYSSYKKNYDNYLAEETDPAKRADYLSQTEQQAKLSGAMFVTATAIWTANLFWAALAPNRYEPLKFRPLTLTPSADPVNGSAFLTLRYNF